MITVWRGTICSMNYFTTNFYFLFLLSLPCCWFSKNFQIKKEDFKLSWSWKKRVWKLPQRFLLLWLFLCSFCKQMFDQFWTTKAKLNIQCSMSTFLSFSYWKEYKSLKLKGVNFFESNKACELFSRVIAVLFTDQDILNIRIRRRLPYNGHYGIEDPKTSLYD